MEGDGDAPLHVDRPPAPELAVDEAGGEVPLDGDGVEVAGDDDAPGPAQVGACHHGVAVAEHLQVGVGTERGLHGVGERPFVARDGRDVAEGGGERDGVRQVQHGAHPSASQSPARCRVRAASPSEPVSDG